MSLDTVDGGWWVVGFVLLVKVMKLSSNKSVKNLLITEFPGISYINCTTKASDDININIQKGNIDIRMFWKLLYN